MEEPESIGVVANEIPQESVGGTEVKEDDHFSADHLDDSNFSLPIEQEQECPPFEEDQYQIPGIPMSRLEEHIHYLLQRVDPSSPYSRNGFDEEFAFIEHETTQDQYFGDYSSALMPPNKCKNRYSNVLPTERTRVKLTPDEDGSDFINANYISGLIPGSERAYIATQGPLTSTFNDFWRMIWELQVTIIVMLTREIEDGRLKCDRYWPDPDCPLTCGSYRVTLTEQTETCRDELITRSILIQHVDSGEEREVTQLQYIAWPDHGIPLSTTMFLDLMDLADSLNPMKAPIVIHCSAGIGRSGTYCTVHSVIEKMKMELQQINENNTWQEPIISIPQTVMYMRSMRPGMVQTKEQYMFVYLTILEKIREIYMQLNPTTNLIGSDLPPDEVDSSTTEDETSESEDARSRSASDSRSRSHSTNSTGTGSSNSRPQSAPDQESHPFVKLDSSTESVQDSASDPTSDQKETSNHQLDASAGSSATSSSMASSSSSVVSPSVLPPQVPPVVVGLRRGSVDVPAVLDAVNHHAQVKEEPKESE